MLDRDASRSSSQEGEQENPARPPSALVVFGAKRRFKKNQDKLIFKPIPKGSIEFQAERVHEFLNSDAVTDPERQAAYAAMDAVLGTQFARAAPENAEALAQAIQTSAKFKKREDADKPGVFLMRVQNNSALPPGNPLKTFRIPPDLAPMKSPSEYQELEKYGVTERTLTTNAQSGASITLWEKKAEKDKPHYIVFSGRTGHWGDTGPGVPGFLEPGYERNSGLQFLEAIAKSGGGFTAVTMRGYGNNGGVPSERGFREDISAFVNDWMENEDRPPAHRLVVSGHSMGAANAAITAAELTRRGEVPALLALSNPFSSMGKQAEEFLAKMPEVQKMNLSFPEHVIEKDMLKHPFRTLDRLGELRPDTHIFIATGEKDSFIDPSHSVRLMKIAKKHHLVVQQHPYPECDHGNIPMADLVDNINRAFEKSVEAARSPESWVKRMDSMRDGVHTPRSPLFHVGSDDTSGPVAAQPRR